MSVSGLKAELKFLASIFDKSHERFRIVSWKLDELHCQFLVPRPAPPGGPRSPAPPPLTLHCNITVRRPGAGPGGAPSARTEGARPSPAGTGPGPAVAALGRDGSGGEGRAALPAGLGLGRWPPLGPGRRAPSPPGVATAAPSRLVPGAAGGGSLRCRGSLAGKALESGRLTLLSGFSRPAFSTNYFLSLCVRRN